MFALLWEQLKHLLDAAVPLAAQVALVYLIVRFAFAIAGLLLELAESSAPRPQPANGPANPPAGAQQPLVAGGQARPGIPERASR